MSTPENPNQVKVTEAQVMRGAAVLKVFMDEGWIAPMNPEELDVISYAVQLFAGEPGTHEIIEDSPEPWLIIERGAQAIMDEHIVSRRRLADAQAAAANNPNPA